MIRETNKKRHRRKSSRELDQIEWSEYAQISPGEYDAYCCYAQAYKDQVYKRWTCILRFNVLRENGDFIARIPIWLSLGNGEKARASRRGRYLQEWVKANGGPPHRADRLSPQVFKNRIARVKVGDTGKGLIPYSVVKEIVLWKTGKSGHSVSQSTSQG